MPPIALQLYSVRSEPDAALPRVLDRLAALGFHGVEPAGLWGRTPGEFRRCCQAVGLEIPALHLALPLEGDARPLLDAAAELGTPAVVVPLVPRDALADADRIQRVAERLDHLARQAAERGLALGYHNHEWEFALRPGGVPAHRRLFDALAPEVFAEIDVYWARVGGADPAQEIERLGPRARMLHLKDGPADSVEAPMTALGAGVIELERVLAASRAVWHVIEIDHCAGDLWQTIAQSRAYLDAVDGVDGSGPGAAIL